jgi:hypothetical protein
MYLAHYIIVFIITLIYKKSSRLWCLAKYYGFCRTEEREAQVGMI